MTLVLEIFETSPSTELPCKLPVQRRSCVFAAWKVGLALSVMACLSLVPLSVMACLSPASLSMTREKKKEAGMVKVFFADRFHRTAGHRFRTGWTGYRFIPVKFKIKFKRSRCNGQDRLAGRFVGKTGPVAPVTGL